MNVRSIQARIRRPQGRFLAALVATLLTLVLAACGNNGNGGTNGGATQGPGATPGGLGY